MFSPCFGKRSLYLKNIPKEGRTPQKRNYQREMDALLERLEGSGELKHLFLHCCCAPCSSYVLEYLSRYFKITAFFYNPNMDTREEYLHRYRELVRFINEKKFDNPIEVFCMDYEPKEFLEKAALGYEDCREGGARCLRCFELRLNRTAAEAKKVSADFFATTLTVSPLKNAAAINEIGERLGKVHGVQYLASDFKKKNGYKRTIELSGEFGLYRQDFCGCVYSRRQRIREKAMENENKNSQNS